MQFSKVSLVICALAAGATLTIRAEDNAAQAKAREALVSKLFEISAQEPATNPPAAPMKPEMEKPAPAPAPVMKQSDEPMMMPVNGDAKAKAKAEKAAKEAELKAEKEAAKQAAAQKTADEAAAKAKAAADLKAQKAAAKQAEDQKAAEVAAAKKQVKANIEAKPAEAPKPVEVMSVPAQNGDTPAQAKAREALAHSLFEMSGEAPTPVTPPAAMTPPDSLVTKPETLNATIPAPKVEPTVQSTTKMVIAPAPIGMAPPLPISVDKQQKLQSLLAKYRADQVTPDEYQKQRAAILAEP